MMPFSLCLFNTNKLLAQKISVKSEKFYQKTQYIPKFLLTLPPKEY